MVVVLAALDVMGYIGATGGGDIRIEFAGMVSERV